MPDSLAADPVTPAGPETSGPRGPRRRRRGKNSTKRVADGPEPSTSAERTEPSQKDASHASRRRPRKSGRSKVPDRRTFHADLTDPGLLETTFSTLSDRIHHEIDTGSYECMICCESIRRRSRVWGCACCWAVFHLKCISNWAKRSQNADSDDNQWRCPGCKDLNDVIPRTYACWCGRVESPPASTGPGPRPPHSCGGVCGRPRQHGCTHPCPRQCHAGPCPPCTAQGPVQLCHCGRVAQQKPCAETQYANGFSCGNLCDQVLSCGRHKCEAICHAGPCEPCTAVAQRKCFCGRETRSMLCHDTGPGKASCMRIEGNSEGITSWQGYWDCRAVCGRSFRCKVHKCTKRCHPQDEECGVCPLDPERVSTCPCGKMAVNRHSCLDDIPTCGAVCNRTLACGHDCPVACHTGPCPPCLRVEKRLCECGSSTVEATCHEFAQGLMPRCTRSCGTLMNCGRHQCKQRCCSGRTQARHRMAAGKMAVGADDFEAEHICTRPCGRELTCGNHTCDRMCHRGPCGVCIVASFDERVCACGRTRMMPPIACGASMPDCPHQCTRVPACGHAPVPHTCHSDSVPCPKCPQLVEKVCACGKQRVANVMCGRTIVSCGQACGRTLRCGYHACQKPCHVLGECEAQCHQPCGKPRAGCGHTCTQPCHAPFKCQETCTALVESTCECGLTRARVPCGAKVECSSACAAERRRKQIREAFGSMAEQSNVDQMAMAEKVQNNDGDNDAAIGVYGDEVMAVFGSSQEAREQCRHVETVLRDFCQGERAAMVLRPMRRELRQVVHALAHVYGLGAETVDPEPVRCVSVFKLKVTPCVARVSLDQAYRAHLKAHMRTAHEASGASGAVVWRRRTAAAERDGYNALLLRNVRVGLLQTEVDAALAQVVAEQPALKGLVLSSHWDANGNAWVTPSVLPGPAASIGTVLAELRGPAKFYLETQGLAEECERCRVVDDVVTYTEREREQERHLQRQRELQEARSRGIPRVTNAFAALDMN